VELCAPPHPPRSPADHRCDFKIHGADDRRHARIKARSIPHRDPDRSGPTAGLETPERIASRISQIVGPDAYERYFRGQTRVDAQPGRIVIRVTHAFTADLIRRRFADSLRTNLDRARPDADPASRTDPGSTVVEIRTEPAPTQPPKRGGPSGILLRPPGSTEGERAVRGPARPPARPRRPMHHQLDRFVGGESNRIALCAARRLCEPDPGSVSPLLIHGGCGLGKTHLLRGIAHQFRSANPGAAVRYLSAESFTNQYIHAVRAGSLDDFRSRFRAMDLICIDDVHFLANKNATQSELLHTFDTLALEGARLVLASDEHPHDLDRFSRRLISRFVSGMVAPLSRPEPDLCRKILRRLAPLRGIRLAPGGIEAIVRCVAQTPDGSVRDLEGLLTQVAAAVDLVGPRDGSTTIDAELVERALRISRHARVGPRRAVRLCEIVQQTCRALNMEPDRAIGPGRSRPVVLARSIVALLAKEMTDMSFPEIARGLGLASHSSVIAARKKILQDMDRDEPLPLIPGVSLRSRRSLVESIRARILREASRPSPRVA